MNVTSKDEIIAILTDIKDGLSDLLTSLDTLGEVLNYESEAVRVFDLNSIELAIAKKSNIHASMRSSIDALEPNVKAFSDAIGFKINQDKLNLSLFMQHLKKWYLEPRENGLMNKVLDHLVQTCLQISNEIISLYQSRKVDIESNVYLVRKSLVQQQDTYRFWQAVAHDSEAVYSSAGKTQKGVSQSLFQVKT